MIEPNLNIPQISEMESTLLTTKLDSQADIQSQNELIQENKFRNKKHQRNYSSEGYTGSKIQYELVLPCDIRKSVNLSNIGNSHMKGIFNEEILFEYIRSRGFIDSTLENKIFEYKSNLSKEGLVQTNDMNHDICSNDNLGKNSNLQNLSLKIEFNVLKQNLDSSNKQLSSLQSILNIKKKKLEILEDTLTKIQQKKNDEINHRINISDDKKKFCHGDQDMPPENNFKRKGKPRSVSISVSVDKKISEEIVTLADTQPSNVYASQHTKSNSILSINQSSTEVENLKREFECLKLAQEDELNSYSEALNKKNNLEIKNEKIIYEEKLRELNSDNQLLINNLQNEKVFLKKKLTELQNSNIIISNHNEIIEEEISSFEEKRCRLIEKLNNYRQCLYNLYRNGNKYENSENNLSLKIPQVQLNSSIRANNNKNIITHDGSQFVSCITHSEKKGVDDSMYFSSRLTNMEINTHQLNYSMDNQDLYPYPQSSKRKISFESNFITNKNLSINTNANPEDYMSNSTFYGVHTIRAFNSKLKENL